MFSSKAKASENKGVFQEHFAQNQPWVLAWGENNIKHTIEKKVMEKNI